MIYVSLTLVIWIYTLFSLLYFQFILFKMFLYYHPKMHRKAIKLIKKSKIYISVWLRSLKSYMSITVIYKAISLCLHFFHLNLPESQIIFFFIYSSKFFHNFHLSESSFTCPRLRASGLARRLGYVS